MQVTDDSPPIARFLCIFYFTILYYFNDHCTKLDLRRLFNEFGLQATPGFMVYEMASFRNLHSEERSRIIVLHEEGLNISQIANELGMSRNTVRLWINRYADEGNLNTRPRDASSRIIIQEEDRRRMVTTYGMHPFTPTRTFAQEFDCSTQTIRRVLHSQGLHHRKPAKKIIMSETNKAARVNFAREYRDFDFSHAIFADEKCFKSSQEGRRHLWRVNSTRYEPRNVNPNRESGRIMANMWGWMSAAGPGELVHISGRANGLSYLELLQESLVPTVRAVYPVAEVPELIFFQDNCPIHTARVVQNWLQELPDIRTVRWPSRSPDLNPIENLWGLMVQRWDNQHERTREALVAHCDKVWDSLRGSDLCEKLVSSMRSRCE